MIGLALVACLSVVGSSMVASATDELDKSVGADFIVQGDTGSRSCRRPRRRMQRTPGLEHVTRYKILDATLTSPDGKTDDDGAHGRRPDLRRGPAPRRREGNLSAAYGPDAMSVGSDYAEKHGVQRRRHPRRSPSRAARPRS